LKARPAITSWSAMRISPGLLYIVGRVQTYLEALGWQATL
jgi:hypothetical protein